MSSLWDDSEDNNPYGSFNRRDSDVSDVPGYHPPSTPPSEDHAASEPETSVYASRPPSYMTEAPSYDDEELDEEEQEEASRDAKVAPKKGGYDSRIEQMLYEHPELEIQIVHAGKNTEGGGGYITYTIRTGDLEVRRRYSEFASLRQTLVNLHPTLIIPPIPEKHSTWDYAAKPTKAKEDVGIIELRQRMLATFLNRCRRMKEVREDGVWWKFLDPNASWVEVLHSHPVVSLPKNNLKAPPLDPANPSPGHNYLPIPSQSAKLRSASGSSAVTASGTPATGALASPTLPTPPPPQAQAPSQAAHTIPGPPQPQSNAQTLGRFPPDGTQLSETDLDPYFVQFEASSRELETLLQGSMEKVNQRSLQHLYKLSEDLMDLGGRYNAFSLSEQSQSVAAAIEKVGQACDFTYIQTRDLSSALSAQFAEPMRESAQFAGIVRAVLRYRVLKRVQEEMTREELERKRTSLDALERSEMEAKRIEQYLNSAGARGEESSRAVPQRSASTGSNAAKTKQRGLARDSLPRRAEDDTASIDSDFPPAFGNSQIPSAGQGAPSSAFGASSHSPASAHGDGLTSPTSPTSAHKRGGSSGNFVTGRLFGGLRHAIHGVVDSDPERARRDQIGKTRESLVQLEQALEVSEKDVKDASAGVLRDLKRFQADKEEDLKKYMLNFAKCHVEWAKRSLETWEEAKTEVAKIDVR